jgi:DNA recombination protein RmuC
MDYIIIGLLVTMLGLVITLFIRLYQNDKSNELLHAIKDENIQFTNKVTEKLWEMKDKITSSIGDGAKENIQDLNKFKDTLLEMMREHFERMNQRIEQQMDSINKRVEYRLNEGFEKTNKTFTNIIERLSKIDEAQKNIEQLSTEVVSLQQILTDKKTRGTFGEVQLNHILSSIFGEHNEKVYQTQATLSNGTRVDALLFLPEETGNLAIDSKFPLENYQKMIDKNLSAAEQAKAEKAFKQDMKKHIDDIASKYIIPTETSDQAVLFVPAEAIFAEINAYHQDIIDYSQKKRVWIASPTTLMSLLTTVQIILRNVERDKYAKIIQEELMKLGLEFNRYKDRWDKLARNIDTVNKSVKEVHITSTKIGKRFEEISKVNLEIDEPDEES